MSSCTVQPYESEELLPEVASSAWPRIWRWAVIAVSVLILCSCKAPPRPGVATASPRMESSVPPEVYTGVPTMPQPPMGPPGMELGVPLPYSPTGPWHPPGIAGPWPRDEYVCDGGNAGPPPRVDAASGEVNGLEMEDTVAKFETVDGRTMVEPSNRVCVYSPRFGAVRQVVNVTVGEQSDRLGKVSKQVGPASPTLTQKLETGTQDLKPIDEVGTRPAQLLRGRQNRGIVSFEIGPRGFDNSFRAYENLDLIRRGKLVASDVPLLAKGANAAVAWTNKQAVQILFDEQAATVEVGDQKPQITYTVGSPPGNPRLRLVKVASTPFAEPGEEVSFTLRFDNVGNQPIKKVTILDSLNTRLEYIPDSAQASVKATFSTQANEGDSVVLRCELADPLSPGKGGVLRFRCRVR